MRHAPIVLGLSMWLAVPVVGPSAGAAQALPAGIFALEVRYVEDGGPRDERALAVEVPEAGLREDVSREVGLAIVSPEAAEAYGSGGYARISLQVGHRGLKVRAERVGRASSCREDAREVTGTTILEARGIVTRLAAVTFLATLIRSWMEGSVTSVSPSVALNPYREPGADVPSPRSTAPAQPFALFAAANPYRDEERGRSASVIARNPYR